MLSISFDDAFIRKFELKIEEAECDFYNNHCSKNPSPSDLEIKYMTMTSNNKGINKDFKKFITVEKTFKSDDVQRVECINYSIEFLSFYAFYQ